MGIRRVLPLAVALLALVGCGAEPGLADLPEHSASQEAVDSVREHALDVGNEIAAGVFVNGPDGVSSGLDRARWVDNDETETVVNGERATVTLWLRRTISREGGGFSSDVEESAVICVEYTVELDGGDTTIREAGCPDDVPSGEHVAEASLGGDVSIDSHDAMRALNRFPRGSDDRMNKYTDTKQAKEKLPDAMEALQPVSEQNVVTVPDVVDALAEVGLEVSDSLERDRGIRFGAGVGRGCVFGTVGPGVLEVEAGGYLADGQGCIDTGR